MPVITFSTSGAESIDKAHDRADARAKKTQANYRQTAAEARNLGRIEERIIRDTETARERYNRKISETRQALAGNARETELVRRAETQLKLEYARSADANKKLMNQRREAAKQALTQERLLREGAKKTNDEIAGSTTVLEGLGKKVVAYGATFLTVRTAVQAITAELKAQQELIDRRTQTQLTISESRNLLLRNLDESKPDEIRRVQRAAIGLARETGVSEHSINVALASAVSSTGGNVPLATNLVSLATRYLKDRPSEIGDFAGSLADLTRITNSTDPEVQLGLLRRVGQLSRITESRAQAENIAPALIGTAAFGGTAPVSGALFAALTTGAADVKGASSGTALIALAAQLEDATKGTNSFRETKNSPGPIRGLAGSTDLGARVAYLQAHPQDAKYFLEQASFEKKLLGPITQLLTDPRSQVALDYAGNRTRIPGIAGLNRIGERTLGIFDEFNTLEPVAERRRRLDSLVEQYQTRKPSRNLDTHDLENLRTIALETGSTAFGAKLDEYVARIKGHGVVSSEEAIKLLESRRDELEHPVSKRTFTAGDLTVPVYTPRAATPEEKQSAKLLKQAVDELKKTNATLDNASRSGGIIVGGE